MSFVGLAIVLLVVGAALDAPALVVIGLVIGLVEVLRRMWQRRGLTGIEYERTLGATKVVLGDEIPLRMTVWNRKLLPVAWLNVDDHMTEGASIRERTVTSSDRPGLSVLRNGWTLGPFERVVREQHIVAERRGRFRFGPVRLEAADLFAGGWSAEERALPDAYLVAPRSVPIHAARTRLKAPPGELPAPGLVEDPALFAGLRPYQPGDPMRRIHWKAAARTGIVRSKRFDSSRERELVIALDIQTLAGPHWLMDYDDDAVEDLCVAAASMARDTIGLGGACGLVAAAFTESREWQQRIAPARGRSQLRRLNDALARLSPFASGPFELMLASLPRWLGRPATILSVSVRDPLPYLGSLKRLAAQGMLVRHVALGPDAAAARARLSRAGVTTLVGRLAPDWRTSEALELAG